MTTRHRSLYALVAVPLLMGAQARSTNFVVTAPTPDAAKQFAEAAEYYRKQKALEWLGHEMPNWPQPCPLEVKATVQEGGGGATTFHYTGNSVIQKMEISGSYEKMLHSVLPHEVTHTVFAHYFRQPMPRWADEGGSVLSENDTERARHDSMCRQFLNGGRGMRLASLFRLTEYPRDVMVLYAQGFSVTRFLVESADRGTFLQFIRHGMQYGWDQAARQFYGFQNVDDLEAKWIESLKRPRPAPVQLAQNRPERQPAGAELTNRVVTRQSALPTQPVLEPPIVTRGQSPESGRPAGTFGNPNPAPPPQWPGSSYPPAPPRPPVNEPPQVRLGPPEPLPPGR